MKDKEITAQDLEKSRRAIYDLQCKHKALLDQLLGRRIEVIRGKSCFVATILKVDSVGERVFIVNHNTNKEYWLHDDHISEVW